MTMGIELSLLDLRQSARQITLSCEIKFSPTDLGERFEMAAISPRVERGWVTFRFLLPRGAVGIRRWLRIILTHGLWRAQ